MFIPLSKLHLKVKKKKYYFWYLNNLQITQITCTSIRVRSFFFLPPHQVVPINAVQCVHIVESLRVLKSVFGWLEILTYMVMGWCYEIFKMNSLNWFFLWYNIMVYIHTYTYLHNSHHIDMRWYTQRFFFEMGIKVKYMYKVTTTRITKKKPAVHLFFFLMFCIFHLNVFFSPTRMQHHHHHYEHHHCYHVVLKNFMFRYCCIHRTT